MKKKRNIIFIVIIGLVLFSGVVYAATTAVASGVLYDNTTSGLSATTVQAALDELNTNANNANDLISVDGLASYITDLYADAKKTTATNNSVTYNYAPSVSLMNDRRGGTTASLDGGNIRYYGASPNNYIYFNCSDYSSQSSSTCELWRIIGVFDGKVKIVRKDSIGQLAWDQDKNIDSSLTTHNNDWSNSSLQILLNEKYYYGDTSGTVTYYSGSTGTTETSLVMSDIGIKNDTTRNMISNTIWYLGGYSSASVYANQIYNYERGSTVYSGNPTSWVGKIALMSPSDYGYAIDFSLTTGTSSRLNSTNSDTYNWVHAGQNQLLLNSSSTKTDYIYVLYIGGGIDIYGYDDSDSHHVRPTLYLNPDVKISTGNTGSSSDPYRISVS